MLTTSLEFPTDWRDYELLDCGDGGKLERFGEYMVVRPDPRAIWLKSLQNKYWENADATFIRDSSQSGQWQLAKPTPNPWIIKYKELAFYLRPTDFKHVGVFPEQAVNWDWLTAKIRVIPSKILNLFAYTGGATLAASAAGASVTHVESAKSTLSWARDNTILSNLDNKPIRWICDDAYKFVIRESKRGVYYDGIVMDPPRFGRGPKGEVWKITEGLPKLLHACTNIIQNPSFVLVNAYTADISHIALGNLLDTCMKRFGGKTTSSEIALRQAKSERMLPCGIVARWEKQN